MTRLVLTPQMPASWMLALADGGTSNDPVCTACEQAKTMSLIVAADPFGAHDGQAFLPSLASQQLQVVRLMLDWLKVSLGASATRPERGRGVAAAAAEAARQYRVMTERRPSQFSLAKWAGIVDVVKIWAEANDAIEAFAIVRAGASRNVDLLHRDALRTSARDTTRQLTAARTALLVAGEAQLAGAMSVLADAFEELGGVEHHAVLARFEAAVTAWAELVPRASADSWLKELTRPLRELGEALCVWVDGVGAGGDVTANLNAERPPVRLAAWSAAGVAARIAATRAGDIHAANWGAQAEAARALAVAAVDTDRVTHAGTSNAGPIAITDEQPLDERQLQLTASAASAAWLHASTRWATLGEDDVAHACRSTAVALGAVAVLDGITAATLGWAAREAWRAVG